MNFSPDDFLNRIISSRFVCERLCQENLGGGRRSSAAARLYLQLPVRARPQLSHFFDRDFYLLNNPDVAAAGVDPFIHFVLFGFEEHRSPHPLIDSGYIRAVDPYLISTTPDIEQLCDVLYYDLADPSPYFDLKYYRGQLADGANQVTGLFQHFVQTGLPLGLKPSPLFDPGWYYRQLDGVHDVWSGLRHFVLRGDREGLAPSPLFSGKQYLERHPDVADAGLPALFHYVTKGNAEGRVAAPEHTSLPSFSLARRGQDATDATIEEAVSNGLYRQFRDSLDGLRQRQKDAVTVEPRDIIRFDDPLKEIAKLALPRRKEPRVSILVPVYNELGYTVECIGSVPRSRPKVSYELIVADDASPDPSIARLGTIKNLHYLAQPTNLGFLENCNAAFHACRGEYVLLLNNDAQLLAGALDAMVAVLDANPDVAAVGPKILYPNGRLQEAGCAVDRDGGTIMVGLFADPGQPCFSYTRDVHYCSGAALLVRRSEIGDTLFDKTFMPAYCEDVDLCLRLLSRGHRVVYCPEAEVVHHLSVSTNKQSVTKRLQLVARNQQKLLEKWPDLLADLNKARVIAFYLPQYHTTAENDFYWGQGFTEWTNVAKATPGYVGHYQPHLPTDLGFYDLRLRQTFERQVALARRYGISGFCVYYYNFGPRRALDEAFEATVADQSIDFPYCVCWANENWTRHWDGGTRAMVFEQAYDTDTLLSIIGDATRYAADPRQRPAAAAARRGRLCRDAGFDGVHLVYVESMETAANAVAPADLGFDACVEFPPQGRAVRLDDQPELLRPDFVGTRYDYEASVLENLKRPGAGYKRYPAVFPSWDNTPRQPNRGDSFVGASPEVFQVFVEEKLEEMRRMFVGDERMLFVNAWNEWAEGTHLEPDRKFGHRWLEAIRGALLAKSLV